MAGPRRPGPPGAWLTTVAKRRAIDLFRRHRDLERKYDQIGRALDGTGPGPGGDLTGGDLDGDAVGDIDDDMLRLIFTACHPVLAVPARVALTLRLLGGLSTAEIARAYLVPEPTVAQRIVRAKKTLGEASVPFEVPRREQRPARLASVLEVIYLVFNEGYSATAGDDWMRPDLCAEALRLGRMLAELAPAEPEVHGLVALMEIQASRIRRPYRSARRADLLLDQDRSPVGPAAASAGAWPRWRARKARRPAGRTRCRPRSPPATPGRSGRKTPTGPGSPSCTACWPRCSRHR